MMSRFWRYPRLVLETLTLDQLRLFLSVVEEGSFSAAGRKLGRVQSAVSQGVAKLESSLGVTLFERGGRRPKLTPEGRTLMLDARQVFADVAQLRGRAAALAGGLEHEVSVAVDAIAPAQLIVEMCRRFKTQFPAVTLRIQTEVLDSVSDLVVSGTCQLGISGPVGSDVLTLTRRFLSEVTMVPVAAPNHPLALAGSPVPSLDARRCVQVVISRRSVNAGGPDIGVLADHTWRVADTALKLSLIRAGLGWGNLPSSLVECDLRSGALVRLELEAWGPNPIRAPLYAITRSDAALGQAGQWLLQSLHAGDIWPSG